MKNGIAIVFAAVVALGASWCGLVLAPTLQLGGAKLTTVLNSPDTYPLQRTGEASLGLQIYRANGCAACHTEQVRQDGIQAELMLTALGNYQPEDFKAFTESLFVQQALEPVTNALAINLKGWNGSLPFVFLTTSDKEIADKINQSINVPGVKSELRIVATGADLARGWGPRRSVAADYLYDQPVQLGRLRAGPDLANIGVRQPDANWQLLHLYAPKAVVPNSTMPSFKYLFAVRKIGAALAPEALKLNAEFAPAAGYEVVPTAAAKELVAYLLSLRANVPLYEAPFTPVTTKP